MGQVSPWVNADIVYDSPEQGHRTPIQTSSWCHLATLRRETAINIVSSFQVSHGLKQAGRQWYGVMYRAFADFDCKKLKPIQLLLPPLWVTHSHPGYSCRRFHRRRKLSGSCRRRLVENQVKRLDLLPGFWHQRRSGSRPSRLD